MVNVLPHTQHKILRGYIYDIDAIKAEVMANKELRKSFVKVLLSVAMQIEADMVRDDPSYIPMTDKLFEEVK